MIPIKKITGDFNRSIIRFPIPILCGVIAFLFIIVENHFIKDNDLLHRNFVMVKLILSTISAIAAFIAIAIYGEINNISKSTRLGFFLLVFCILGLHFYSVTPAMFDSDTIFISRYLLFFVIFHLLVSVAAYYQEKDISRFWQFNDFLFLRLFTSIIFSIVLFIGLASAFWAIDKLFSIDIHPKFYVDLVAFIFLIFNTLFFLMGIPKDFSVFSDTIEFKKSLRIFVQYILLPIIGIYLLILYFYLFRIVFIQKIPNGNVCIPILIFSILGILAYLLIYPIRNKRENNIIFIFARYFYFLLLPLLSLYFIAIFTRIKPYGITEDRYLIFVLGLWLLVISLYIIFSKKDNIIIIPLSLIVILFMSSIGPWGMFQLSIQNQVLRLERNLKRNNILINNEIVNDKSTIHLSENDASSIQSILQFLYKRDELEKVKKWLPENELQNLKLAIDSNHLYKLYPVFGINESQDKINDAIYVNVNNDITNLPIDVSGYHYIQNVSTIKELNFLLDNENSLFCEIENHNKKINLDTILNYSILKSKLLEKNQNTVFIDRDSLTITSSDSKLIIEYLEIQKQDTTYTITQLNGFYLY